MVVRMLALAVLLLLAACGATAAPGPPNTPLPTATTGSTNTPIAAATAATSAPASTPRPGTVATPRPATPPHASPTTGLTGPPPLTLAYSTATRVARPHSASWTTPGGGGMIADGAPVLSQLETLTVPLGATLTVAAPALPGPTAATAQAYAVVNGQLRYSTPGPSSLPIRLTPEGATLAADLAPGEYLLLINLTWGNNQASYGFRVAIATGAVPPSLNAPLDWPSDLSLSYGGITRHARAVSAAWSNANGGVNGDGFPYHGGSELLVAPGGATLTLSIGGSLPPTGVEVSPYTIVNGQAQVGAPYLSSLPVTFAGYNSVVTADLAPGDYLIEINVYWGTNRAGYGFRLTITP